MNCKRCGAELENNARFCPTCGALQPVICPACGAVSRPGSRESSACGRKLPLAERESKLVYTKRKKHTGAIIGTVIPAAFGRRGVAAAGQPARREGPDGAARAGAAGSRGTVAPGAGARGARPGRARPGEYAF